MKRGLCLLALLALLVLGGCSTDHLETGYVFTPLGDSSAKRRGYYADPFSPEAHAAQTEQQATDSGVSHRLVPGQ